MDREAQYLKITIPFKSICKINAIPIKITAKYFVDIEKLILKFTRKQNLRIANTVLTKNKVGDSTSKLTIQ